MGIRNKLPNDNSSPNFKPILIQSPFLNSDITLHTFFFLSLGRNPRSPTLSQKIVPVSSGRNRLSALSLDITIFNRITRNFCCVFLQNDMNLSDEKKAPLQKRTVEQKRIMLAMQYKGSLQVSRNPIRFKINGITWAFKTFRKSGKMGCFAASSSRKTMRKSIFFLFLFPALFPWEFQLFRPPFEM